MRPTEDMSQPHGHCDEGAESENDGCERAPRTVDDQHQRHQENAEQRHEARRRRARLSLEPGVEPRRSDPSDLGNRSAGSLEGQSECIDRRQGAIALLGRVHTQFECNAEVVVAQKSRAAEQRRPARERPQTLGLDGADLPCGARATVEVEEAVGRDVRNLGEPALESVGGAQRGEAQGIRCFEHDERLLALGKQTIEIARGERDGVVGHDQAIDGRIVGHPQGAIDARRGEEQERSGDPGSRTQNVEEELNNLG